MVFHMFQIAEYVIHNYFRNGREEGIEVLSIARHFPQHTIAKASRAMSISCTEQKAKKRLDTMYV